ncbi:hypothetical protein Tco_0190408, partial [Tanacetum coccineum]
EIKFKAKGRGLAIGGAHGFRKENEEMQKMGRIGHGRRSWKLSRWPGDPLRPPAAGQGKMQEYDKKHGKRTKIAWKHGFLQDLRCKHLESVESSLRRNKAYWLHRNIFKLVIWKPASRTLRHNTPYGYVVKYSKSLNKGLIQTLQHQPFNQSSKGRSRLPRIEEFHQKGFKIAGIIGQTKYIYSCLSTLETDVKVVKTSQEALQSPRYEPKAATSSPIKGATKVGNASKSSSMLRTTATQGNIPMSNPYSALDDESDEEVVNVYNESANLFQSKKTSRSSSTFTNAAG